MSEQPRRLVEARELALHSLLNGDYPTASAAYLTVAKDTPPWGIERPEIPHMFAMAAVTNMLDNPRGHSTTETHYKAALAATSSPAEKAEIYLERATAAKYAGLPPVFVKESLIRALRAVKAPRNPRELSLFDIASHRLASL